MVRHKMPSVLVGIVLAAGSLAACGGGGGSHSTSPQAVQSDMRNTANQSGLKLTANLDVSQADMTRQSADLTPAQRQAIVDSDLVLQVHSADGSNLVNAGNGGQVDLSLLEKNSPMGEMRVVGQTLYAKVNIDQFASTYGLQQGEAANIHSQLQQLAPRVGGLSALDKGQWVSVDLNLVNSFAQTAGVTLPSAPQLVGRVVGAFFNAVGHGNHITQASGGRAQINVNAQSLVTSLAQAVQNTPGMSSFGKEITGLSDRAKSSVPATNSGNVLVTPGGGMIQKLELPINQFDNSHTLQGPASVDMSVAKAGAVSAPSGATAINLPQLINAIEGSSS